ncbi:MAG TPA: helix-turn-helix domain-containing protein [Angustibacter sp.]|nr:helix-turn-helix domain-containing protein [Angustibacter sp.]
MHPPSTRAAALAMLRSGRSLNRTSREVGVSRSTLRVWLRHDGAYAPRVKARATCPRDGDLDEVAYAHLLGLYLGDGCLSAHARSVFALRVACDSRYIDLLDECEASMRAVVANSVSRNPAEGCVHVTSYSKHWPCLFPQHGPGRKHERPIVLEAWQRDIVERHPGRFLRGLFHSDGCRVLNHVSREVAGERRHYAYPRYFFSNRSEDILALCEWGLDLLGVAHRRSNRWNVSVARREAVARLDEVVGPKS